MYPDSDGGNFDAAARRVVIRRKTGERLSCVRCEEDLSDDLTV